MLRMVDFRCGKCGVNEELCVRVGDPDPKHCDSTMKRVWRRAPGVHYKPHYSHALGKNVSTYGQEDKELEKKGQWIASKKEASSAYDHEFTDNVTIEPVTKEKIKKNVEKTAAKLVADGVIPGSSQW